ncbi:hypothetical protein GCM10009117_15650 [Gangjinia marincola]|uniref:Mannosyltransferase n=1 Tax=Gangjinia marincola TaxID=578463 RepID=A0ABN1MGV9_9FLAO
MQHQTPHRSTLSLSIGVGLLSAALYYYMAYEQVRYDFVTLFTSYTALFFSCYYLLKYARLTTVNVLLLGLVFRLIFILATPSLSEDVYRFLWDGRLLAEGINPYLYIPNQLFDQDSFFLSKEMMSIFDQMTDLSKQHFSNYPPVNQCFFWLSAVLGGKSILGSIIVLRLIIILSEMGIFFIGIKLLQQLNMNMLNIGWFFLNPFIIIEFTGNLHFETVMIFFILLSLFLLVRGHWVWSAVVMGIAVSVKLIPLMLLPIFFQYFIKRNHSNPSLNFWKLMLYYSVVILTFMLSFSPFISQELLQNYSTTIGLWFQNFEFNASIYYVVRWVGFQATGYNIIASAGRVLPVITVGIILLLTFFRKNTPLQQLITGMLFAVNTYFLFSTTVHPWYIATPLVLGIFTRYTFPVVWSFVVMLSYSAYAGSFFQENALLIAVEYVVLIVYMLYEIFRRKNPLNLSSSLCSTVQPIRKSRE